VYLVFPLLYPTPHIFQKCKFVFHNVMKGVRCKSWSVGYKCQPNWVIACHDFIFGLEIFWGVVRCNQHYCWCTQHLMWKGKNTLVYFLKWFCAPSSFRLICICNELIRSWYRWSASFLWIKLIRKLIFKTYGSSWSVKNLWIKLIYKLLTDQVSTCGSTWFVKGEKR